MTKVNSMLSLVSILLLCNSFTHKMPNDDFKKVKESDNIVLYERWITHTDNKKVRELKSTFSVHSKINTILALLKDPTKGLQWNANSKTYKIDLLPGDNSWMNYIRYTTPWPLDDQECCLLYTYTPGNKSSIYEISFQSALHANYPITSNISRLTGISGKWLIEDVGNNTLNITYLVKSNRNKNIPRWISDPIVHKNLFQTLSSFKNLINQ